MGFAEACPRQGALLIRASSAVEEEARQRHDHLEREIKGGMKKMTGVLKGKEYFRSGEKGVCAICLIGEACAWSDGEEIDCGYGSCHDALHFVWLEATSGRRPWGYVCDSCIDRLVREGRIEAWRSDWHGNLSGVSEKAAALGERLEQKWRAAAQAKRASQGEGGRADRAASALTDEELVRALEAEINRLAEQARRMETGDAQS